MPRRRRSSPMISSPVIKSSLALLMPISSGQITAPPSPATRPTLTWRSPMRARSEATTTSQSRAMVAPRPTAAPLTIASSGFCRSSMEWTISLRLAAHLGGVAPHEDVGAAIALTHALDVAAGAEGSARARQEHDTRFVVVVGVAEDRGELCVETAVHGVEPFRPVEGEHQHRAPAVDLDVLVAREVRHRFTSTSPEVAHRVERGTGRARAC